MLPAPLLLFSFSCVALLYFLFNIRPCHPDLAEGWAVDENWTHDLFLTKEVLYHWATTACLHRDSRPLKIQRLRERKTRFEPATYSLEGCRSTNWATSAFNRQCGACLKRTVLYNTCLNSDRSLGKFVGKDGFEPPNSEEDRFTVCCRWPLGYLPNLIEPEKGLEPPTSWLQISCSDQLSYTGIWGKYQYYKELPDKYTATGIFFRKAKVMEFV